MNDADGDVGAPRLLVRLCFRAPKARLPHAFAGHPFLCQPFLCQPFLCQKMPTSALPALLVRLCFRAPFSRWDPSNPLRNRNAR